MLKVVYKNVKVKVIVTDTAQSYFFDLPIHTTMKELANKICDKLNLDIYRTDISFQSRYSYNKLNPVSTLQQNGLINKNEEIYANIDAIITKGYFYREKQDEPEEVLAPKQYNKAIRKNLSALDLTNKFPTKIDCETYGLNIEGTCVNPKCIYFRKSIIKPFGMGVYNLQQIYSSVKCPTCPYRGQNLNPPIVIKSLRFIGCAWKLTGMERGYKGVNQTVENDEWNYSENSQESFALFCELMKYKKWSEVYIHTKPVYLPKKSNFLKYSYGGHDFQNFSQIKMDPVFYNY